MPWSYSTTRLGYFRNRLAYLARDLYLWPLHRVLNQYRRNWKLSPWRYAEDSFSSLAQITQFIAEFDFPRHELPDHFHYVGPFDRFSPVGVDFPYDRLDGRPLVYLAFGTLIGEKRDIWKVVAEACLELNLQLVISTGRKDAVEELPRLPGDPILVHYAPQSALLQKASIFVTHAGVNSVFEALLHSVPMVAVPFSGDGPGSASRIHYHGLGQILYSKRTDARAWPLALKRILEVPSYRERASYFSQLVRQSGGADRAAEIIEQAAMTRQPVIRR